MSLRKGGRWHQCVIESLETRQLLTTYYVSPNGSDLNPGTSTSQPWQSVGRVDGANLKAGDSVLFQNVLPVMYQPGSIELLLAQLTTEQLQIFKADRAALRKDATIRRPPFAEAAPALQRYLGLLDAQLGDGRAWLLGNAPCIADFSVFHPLWFLRRGPAVAPLLDAH